MAISLGILTQHFQTNPYVDHVAVSPNSSPLNRSFPSSPGRDLNRWSSWPCPERTFKSWASAKSWSLPGGADWMCKNEQLFVCIKVALPDNFGKKPLKTHQIWWFTVRFPIEFAIWWYHQLSDKPMYLHIRQILKKAKSGKRQSCCKMTLGARLFVGSDYEFALGSKCLCFGIYLNPKCRKPWFHAQAASHLRRAAHGRDHARTQVPLLCRCAF